MGCLQSKPKLEPGPDPASAPQAPASKQHDPAHVQPGSTAHLKSAAPAKGAAASPSAPAAGITSSPAAREASPYVSPVAPGSQTDAPAQYAGATSLPAVHSGQPAQSPADPTASGSPGHKKRSHVQGAHENATPLPPLNEEARVATVERLECTHAAVQDPQGNLLTQLLSDLGRFPLCCIVVVGENKQWMKWAQRDKFHVVKSHNNVFPKAMGLAPWVLSEEVTQMIVLDRRVDDIRFRNDEVAKTMGTALATPITASDGHRIGAMVCCCMETRPVTYEFCALLNNMAELAARELEKHALIDITPEGTMKDVPSLSASQQYRHLLGTEHEPLTRSIESLSRGIILCDASKPRWPVVFVTTVMARLANREPQQLVGKFFDELFEATDDKEGWEAQQRDLVQHKRKNAMRSARGRAPTLDPELWVSLAFYNATTANLECEIGIPSFAEHPDDEPAAEDLCFYTITVNQQASGPPEGDLGHPASRVSSFSAQAMGRAFSSQATLPDPSQLLFEEAALETLLGKGSFGCVFRATWRQQEVALKVLEWPSTGEDVADAKSNEMKEAALAIEFSHPNIVRTLAYAVRPKKAATDTRIQIASPGVKLDNDLVEVRGKSMAPGQKGRSMEAWIVMELCSRGCLQDANDRGWLFTKNAGYGVPSPDLLAVITCSLEIAQGMAYLHEQGCVHRDLTSGNVLLAANNTNPWGFTCKIADFGMSRIMEKSADPTDTVTMGTVTHMPPELLLEGKLSPAADVYAFGVLMWSMLTGERPFNRMSRVQVMVTICIQKKQLELPDNLPASLSELTKACLATNPKDRPTFEEAVVRLQSQLAEVNSGTGPGPA